MKSFKKVTAFGVVSALAVALTACGGGASYDEYTEEEALEAAMEELGVSDEEMAERPEPMLMYDGALEFTTGFEEDYANYSMFLNQITDGWLYPESSPAYAVSPSAGMKNVLLNISVTNPDTNEMNVSPLMNDFALYFGDEAYKPVWFMAGSGLDEFPSMLDVAVGATETKDLLFEVPAESDLVDAVLKFEAVTPSVRTPEIFFVDLLNTF